MSIHRYISYDTCCNVSQRRVGYKRNTLLEKPKGSIAVFVISRFPSLCHILMLFTCHKCRACQLLHGTIDVSTCWHRKQSLSSLRLTHPSVSYQSTCRFRDSHQHLLDHQVWWQPRPVAISPPFHDISCSHRTTPWNLWSIYLVPFLFYIYCVLPSVF